MIAVEVDMVRVCCVCRKIEQCGQWLRTAVYPGQKVSHAYCPACFDDLMDAIDRYALQEWSRSVYTVVEAVKASKV